MEKMCHWKYKIVIKTVYSIRLAVYVQHHTRTASTLFVYVMFANIAMTLIFFCMCYSFYTCGTYTSV